MYRVLLAYFILLVTSNVFASENPDILILSLHKMLGSKVTSKIELFANDIDPNTSSINDRYRIEINGKTKAIPIDLLSKLDLQRREYSSEQFTGGIKIVPLGTSCRMEGPSESSVLIVRYLTYDMNFKIIKDEMLPVYSENENCLLIDGFVPRNQDAEKVAAKTMAILKTIKEYSE